MSLSILRGRGSGCFGKDDERDTATENRECWMVVSESFLYSTRRMVESWVFAKRGIVRLAASGGWNVIRKRLRRGCNWLVIVGWLAASISGLGNG